MQVGPISRPEHERPHHEQFEPNLGKPARGGPYGQGQGAKGHYKGGGQTRGRDSRRERASKAEAHREVWPMVTLKEIPTGFRAIATRGTGTNNEAGTGAGPELLDDSH